MARGRMATQGASCVTALLVALVLRGGYDASFACDKKGHDCHTRVRRAGIENLPFRVADILGLFGDNKVFPDIQIVDGANRLQAVLSGEAFLATASPLEVASFAKTDNRIRIVSLIQTRPLFYLTGAGTDPREVKGREVAVRAGFRDEGYLQVALSEVGLSTKDYSLVQVTPAELPGLLAKKGSIVLLEGSSAFRQSDNGGLSVTSYLKDGMAAVLVGRADELERQAAAVWRIMQATSAAVSWLYQPQNQAKVTNLIGQEYDLSDRAATSLYRDITKLRVYSTDLSDVQALLRETNQWLRPSGLAISRDLVDLSYLKPPRK